MLVEGLLLLVTGAGLALAVAACGCGHRIPGPSWFDIPQPVGNRASERTSAGYQRGRPERRGFHARMESRTAERTSGYHRRGRSSRWR